MKTITTLLLSLIACASSLWAACRSWLALITVCFLPLSHIAHAEGADPSAYDEVLKLQPVGFWPLEADEGERVIDLSPTANHGRAINVPRDPKTGLTDFANAFKFRENIKPYRHSLQNAVTFGDEWILVDQAFKAKGNYQPGQAGIEFSFGFYPQRLQLGGIQLVSYKKALEPKDLPKTIIKARYLGMKADAPWRKEAQARIEKIRKGDFELRLTRGGKPVAKTEARLFLIISDGYLLWQSFYTQFLVLKKWELL